MDNIDRFNTLVGMIFEELYRSFPIPISRMDGGKFLEKMGVEVSFSTNSLQENVLVSCGVFPETDIPAHSFYVSTTEWLQSEGFTKSGCVQGDSEVFLTAKALAALNAIPDSLDKKSLGKKLGEAAKDMGSDVANKTLADLAGQALGGFTKSVLGL